MGTITEEDKMFESLTNQLKNASQYGETISELIDDF